MILQCIHSFSFIPFQVLKRNGIKGPTPSFFYGNCKEIEKVVCTLLSSSQYCIHVLIMKGFVKFVEELCRKYGPVVGYKIMCIHFVNENLILLSSISRFYVGKNPVILVMDIELIKHITVKDFDSFTNRPVSTYISQPRPRSSFEYLNKSQSNFPCCFVENLVCCGPETRLGV